MSETASFGSAKGIGNVVGWAPSVADGTTQKFSWVATDQVAGGTSVTITGTDLEGATAVTFNGTPAVITADSETSITVVSPPKGEEPRGR
jgi:IPT/TIG domain